MTELEFEMLPPVSKVGKTIAIADKRFPELRSGVDETLFSDQ